MKKLNKIALLAVFLVAFSAMFCACNLIKDAEAISIKSMPKTSYISGDTDFDWSGFVLTVDYKGNKASEDFTYEDLQKAASFKVSEFDGSVGTHTATVKYLGCSISFSYTVAAQAFAGGEGTKANPYQIASAEQFANLGTYYTTTYFTLINDIDLGEQTSGDNPMIETCYGAVIDGNGYALRNVKFYVFYYFRASEFKNIDVYMNSNAALFVSLGKGGDRSPVVVENVNIYGLNDISNEAGQNDSILAGYVQTTNCTIKDVNVYADFLTNTNYGGIFIGYSNFYGGTLTFENCKYFGYAQGRRLGLFVGNIKGGGNANRVININGTSGNYGTINTTEHNPQAILFASQKDQSLGQAEYIKVYDDGTLLTTEEQNGSFNFGSARQIKEPSLKLTVGANNELMVECTNESVSYYKVIAEVWTKVYDIDRETYLDTTATGTLLTQKVNTTGATGVYFASWVLNTGLNGSYAWNTELGKYEFNDADLFSGRYFVKKNAEFGTNAAKRENNVRYTVFAYDADGKLLGSFTYGL